MTTKYRFSICPRFHSFGATCAGAIILMFGVLAGSAQTGNYLFSGSEETTSLNPGIYDITAYGAQGGYSVHNGSGGLGAEMDGEFSLSATTTLTLLVGGSGFSLGGGGGGAYGGGGGGGYSSNGSGRFGGGVIDGGGGGFSFLNGGAGGYGFLSGSSLGATPVIMGGYGGGGAGGVSPASVSVLAGGGGGGYSGGGGAGALTRSVAPCPVSTPAAAVVAVLSLIHRLSRSSPRFLVSPVPMVRPMARLSLLPFPNHAH